MADFNLETFGSGSLTELSGSDANLELFGSGVLLELAHSSPNLELFAFGGGAADVTYYVNRVFDTVAVGFVRWTTATTPDPTGTFYPGPGTFGVNTSDYCIERVFEA